MARSREQVDLEFLNRLLEIYTFEELLELNDLTQEEALEILILDGAITYENLPTGLS